MDLRLFSILSDLRRVFFAGQSSGFRFLLPANGSGLRFSNTFGRLNRRCGLL